MELLLTISLYYSLGFIIFILINAFLAGYNSTELSKQELVESLLWPVSTLILIGTISYVIVKKIFKGI